jgi:flavin-dependent dehydrogenase
VWPDILARPHIRAVLGDGAGPEAPHRAWPIPARVERIRLAAGRALFVGDAAAASDPMTGEGIAQALLTGELAARAIVDTGPGDPGQAAVRYGDGVRRELVPDARMSRLLIRALRHRRGTDWALAVAAASPWTRRNFARWLFEDYPRAFVATPGRWGEHSMRGPGAWAGRRA